MTPQPAPPRFETFPERDEDGQPTGSYRWRLRAANGRIDGQGTESYRDQIDAERGALDACSSALAAAGVHPGSVASDSVNLVHRDK